MRSNNCSSLWFDGFGFIPLSSNKALATAILASFIGMFVYRLVTSRVTSSVFDGNLPSLFVSSKVCKKCPVSFKYDGIFYRYGCKK